MARPEKLCRTHRIENFTETRGGDLGDRGDHPLKYLGGGTEVLLSPNV